MICPHCDAKLTDSEIVALFSSWRGSRPKPPNPKSAENGKKGGRPKGSKTKNKEPSNFDEPQSAFLWNDCGVCTNPQTAVSHCGHGWSYSILLAQKPNGLWVCGYDYTIKNGGGGGYPNLCDTGHETAEMAIEQEIISVRAKIN